MKRRYEVPVVVDLGRLDVVTLGMHFSRCDGNSGNAGDKGTGDPNAPGFPDCTQVKGGGK